jgi:hypothetical protein
MDPQMNFVMEGLMYQPAKLVGLVCRINLRSSRSGRKLVASFFARFIAGAMLLCVQSAYAQQVPAGPLDVDPTGLTAGTLDHAIVFSAPITFSGVTTLGPAHNTPSFTIQNGVGIASNRSGPNNGGLDFYTPGDLIGPNVKAQVQMSVTPGGNVGIGTQDPRASLEIAKRGYAQINLNSTDGRKWALMSTGSSETNPGDFQIYDLTANLSRLKIDQTGKVAVNVLQINGGSDVAEPFQILNDHVAEGSVVVIDEDDPGRLKLATSAYDTRVAGVISGAGGVVPGLSLQQKGLDGGQNVALGGRVYVLADASAAPIHPGDLLTTSDQPGYCMKAVDRSKAQGAILGKAMGKLDRGRGLVLILVSLQ